MTSVAREVTVRSVPVVGTVRRALALLAEWPLERAVAAMAVALLGNWLVALATPLPFAPNAAAEWIMARTPADLANTLLERLGTFARPAAVLGGFACYLALAVAVGVWDAVLRRLMPAVSAVLAAGARLLPVAAVWGTLVRALELPLDANALTLALFVALWLAPGLPAVRPGERRDRSRRAFLQVTALAGGAVLLSANAAFLQALARAASGVRLGGDPALVGSQAYPELGPLGIETTSAVLQLGFSLREQPFPDPEQ